MENEFYKFVCNYNLDDINIKLKYNHSNRVMELSKKYAKELGFNDYDIQLATLIGLLHDIGRFEQLRLYNSYNDSDTIDHADFGVKLLFEDGLIKQFWSNEEDYELIKFAIKNHNKFKMEDTNNERFLKHAKLIRDTDKIDIMYVYGISDELKIRGIQKPVSNLVLNSIKEHKQVLTKDVRNKNDEIVLAFAYAFDINNDICLNEFKTNLNIFFNNLKYKEDLKEAKDIVDKYIDERMSKYVRQEI